MPTRDGQIRKVAGRQSALACLVGILAVCAICAYNSWPLRPETGELPAKIGSPMRLPATISPSEQIVDSSTLPLSPQPAHREKKEPPATLMIAEENLLADFDANITIAAATAVEDPLANLNVAGELLHNDAQEGSSPNALWLSDDRMAKNPLQPVAQIPSLSGFDSAAMYGQKDASLMGYSTEPGTGLAVATSGGIAITQSFWIAPQLKFQVYYVHGIEGAMPQGMNSPGAGSSMTGSDQGAGLRLSWKF